MRHFFKILSFLSENPYTILVLGFFYYDMLILWGWEATQDFICIREVSIKQMRLDDFTIKSFFHRSFTQNDSLCSLLPLYTIFSCYDIVYMH